MPDYYDLTLDDIELPTMSIENFSEQLGGDFELVGAVPMPGSITPSSMYTCTIPIYGDMTDPDPYTAGNTKRAQVRALLQDAPTRFAGVQFDVIYDPEIAAWIVIPTATVSYGGGPDFGDFVLQFSGAAVIPDVLVFLARRLTVADRRLPTVALDHSKQMRRAEPLKADAAPRHYLGVGVTDVTGRAQPRLVETHAYHTIFGEAAYIEDRQHLEVVTYEQALPDRRKGNVRVYDPTLNTSPEFTKEGDLDPEKAYRWPRLFGPGQYRGTAVPVLDNGVCRIRHDSNTRFYIDLCRKGRYSPKLEAFDLGYETVTRAFVARANKEISTIRLDLADGKNRRGTAYVTLQRGWPGPAIDLYHLGAAKPMTVTAKTAHVERQGTWEHVRIGAEPSEALVYTVQEHRRIMRS